jgi:hypothetical protein
MACCMSSRHAYSTAAKQVVVYALELQHQVDGQTGVQGMLSLQPEHYQALLH